MKYSTHSMFVPTLYYMNANDTYRDEQAKQYTQTHT